MMLGVLGFLIFLVLLALLDVYSRLGEVRDFIKRTEYVMNKAEEERLRKERVKETREKQMAEMLKRVDVKAASSKAFEEIAFLSLFESYSWTTKEEWIYTLIKLYPAEVVKEYGRNLQDVISELSLLWTCCYKDELGLDFRFCDWAILFNNKPAIQIYLLLLSDKNAKAENVISLVRERERNIYNQEE